MWLINSEVYLKHTDVTGGEVRGSQHTGRSRAHSVPIAASLQIPPCNTGASATLNTAGALEPAAALYALTTSGVPPFRGCAIYSLAWEGASSSSSLSCPSPHLRDQQHVLPASLSQPTWTCESSCFWRTFEGGSGGYPQMRCYLGRTWTPSWKDELCSAEWHTLKFQSHWRNSVMLRGSLTTSCAIGNGNLYFNFRMMQIFWIFWTQRTAKIFTQLKSCHIKPCQK